MVCGPGWPLSHTGSMLRALRIWAVALQLLEQLDWLTPITLEDLRRRFLAPAPHLQLEVVGELRSTA